MKKKLSLLSTSLIFLPLTPSLIGASRNYQEINLVKKTAYSINSFKNLVKIINSNFGNGSNMENWRVDAYLDSIIPNYYYGTMNNKSGEVLTWDSKPREGTTIVKTYEDTFINDSDLAQKRLTQSREETLSENHKISMSITDKVSNDMGTEISGSISIPLGGLDTSVKFNFGFETSQEKSWEDTVTHTVKEIVPSQEIVQNPNTILHVSYIITKGVYDYEGVAKFKVDNLKEKAFRIPFYYFSADGTLDYIKWNSYSMKEILKILKDMGFENELVKGNQEKSYSLLTVDDIEQPNRVDLNLIVNWSSESAGILVKNYEEKI